MFLFRERQVCLDIAEKMVGLEVRANRVLKVKKVLKDMPVTKVSLDKLVTEDHQDSLDMLLKENLAIEVYKKIF